MDTDSIINTEEGRLLPRLEKKARQSLAKLGLKRVEGINRVVLRRPGGVLFIVGRPEVYRAPGSDCYIVFGDAKFEDPNSAGFGAQAMAAAQAAEARQRAEAERQAKAAGRVGGSDEAEGSKPAGGISEGELFGGAEAGASSSETKRDSAADEPEGEVDATGVDAQDIDTVMQQASCSRAKAVKALKEHNGDIVNAIMAAS
ncbi:nascent polypeptide-associated complex, alpha subunit [Cystobasidium minutum MCA 4210]|uniref:nascent polypeptide-associated complex, alpha subunit n=1 Tax=Cystobasidium minutum MCA 4210 TaxID=1397322 RepID=UPI0034CF8BC7|eukprot:jgi/Rhomi1/165726/fgenesh1_kg.1_\